jgi:hypothetical protein
MTDLRRCDDLAPHGGAQASPPAAQLGVVQTRSGVRCFMDHKDSHHRGATGKIGLLSHLKRPHGIAILAIVVFGVAWLVWTFVVQ